jgi:hypothetical protein
MSYDPNAKAPEVGSRWVWEIDAPHAIDVVVVTQTKWNGEEWLVACRSLLPQRHRHVPEVIEEPWNTLSRFREACSPIGGGGESRAENVLALASRIRLCDHTTLSPEAEADQERAFDELLAMAKGER